MRWLRLILRGVLLTLVAGALVLGFLVWRSLADSRGPAELAGAEWQRLTQRFARRAALATQPTTMQQPATRADDPASDAGPAPRAAPVPARVARPAPDAAVLERQAEDYAALRPKTVVELQPFRFSATIDVEGPDGRRGSATLINLNPVINAWYLLTLDWAGASPTSYHLANASPETQDLHLDPEFPHGLVFGDSTGQRRCDLWSDAAPTSLESAARSRSPYVMLCEEQLSLRLQTAGHRTSKEWATDFLRDNIWGGEKITVFVRRTLFKDAYLSAAAASADGAAETEPEDRGGLPAAGNVDPAQQGIGVEPAELGIALDAPDSRLLLGHWYPTRGNPGIAVSAMRAGAVPREILDAHLERTSRLDDVERTALIYLVAFDLRQFELGFSVGTDHPRVGWSERTLPQQRNDSLPGPDGIGTIAPLVATGIIPASVADRTAATFTGGFKRTHGAFKSGELGTRNHGSHYGFIESGVVLSKLQPGLATLLVSDDGRVELKTWTTEDDAGLSRIKHARQNGVPLVEADPQTGQPVPGRLVARWGEGNWSGSQDQKLRTLRAGVCLQDGDHNRFLIYGYFSGATPSAMARVFQAYDCRYAMLTDMNALEHTYLALYHVENSRLVVEHLIEGMNVLDKTVGGQVLPRFLGFADNRDFFYLIRRPRRAHGAPGANAAPAERS